ncbi:MAG: anti-sigma factor [Pseudomonadota bacterium]|mgnify:CR=1 FL=1|nr:anti-sigma factor [Pseudomonadota bacterium]
MNEIVKKFEKLKGLMSPIFIGYFLAIVCLFVALHYVTGARELRNQLGNLSSELLNRKSEVDQLQSELDQIGQKSKGMEQQIAAASEKSAQDQVKIENLETLSKKFSELTAILDSSKLKIIPLITSDPESKANGKFFWVPGLKTASLLVSGLKSNADTSEYQLWMVQQGSVNLNLMSFSVDSPELKVFKLEELPISDPKKLSSILITREPKGGSSKPLGTRVLSGKP